MSTAARLAALHGAGGISADELSAAEALLAAAPCDPRAAPAAGARACAKGGGGLQLWLRPEGGGTDAAPLPLDLAPDATVADAMAAAAAAVGLAYPPNLALGGEPLADPSAPLADLGAGAEAVLSIVGSVTVQLTRRGQLQRGDGAAHAVRLPLGATLSHLREWVADHFGPPQAHGSASPASLPRGGLSAMARRLGLGQGEELIVGLRAPSVAFTDVDGDRNRLRMSGQSLEWVDEGNGETVHTGALKWDRGAGRIKGGRWSATLDAAGRAALEQVAVVEATPPVVQPPPRRHIRDRYMLSTPDEPPRPVPSIHPRWTGQARHLSDESPLSEQGVRDGSVIILWEYNTIMKRKGRPYTPGDAHTEVGILPGAPLPLAEAKAAPRAAADAGADEKGAAARLWAEQAHEELASVAAFSALTLRLMAHAAPPALVDAALRAGRDEVRHAEVCAAIAAELGAAPPASRAVLPPHTLSVAADIGDLAARAVWEGGVGEAAAAAAAAVAAARAECPRIAAAQRRIAADEARHAALAWATAAWAAASAGGAAAREQLQKAEVEVVRRLQETEVEVDSGAGARDAALLRYGVVEGAEKARVLRRTLSAVALPMLRAAVAGEPPPPAAEADDAAPETVAFSAVARETAALLAAI